MHSQGYTNEYLVIRPNGVLACLKKNVNIFVNNVHIFVNNVHIFVKNILIFLMYVGFEISL